MKQKIVIYDPSDSSFHPTEATEAGVVITQDQYLELMAAQERGMELRPNRDGMPIAVMPGRVFEVWNRDTGHWDTDEDAYREYVDSEITSEVEHLRETAKELALEMVGIEATRGHDSDEYGQAKQKVAELYQRITELNKAQGGKQ